MNYSGLVEDYTLSVLEAIENSAKDSLPPVGGGGGKGSQQQHGVAGWYEYVKPY